MTIVNGHFDGERVILDEPVPASIPSNTPVQVIFDGAATGDGLAKIADLAVEAELPADYSQQHEHYVKGTPKR